MACPHLKHSIISKSKGGSIIASSAYNRREKMFDELEHKMKYPHTKADDHVLTKMLLPEGTPSGYADPSRIWNDLNKIEDDRTGYKLIIPFQKELSFEQNLELAIELLNEEYVKKGHPVQIDVHRGKNGNDHLHAIASDRRLVNGKWDNRKSETIYYKRGTVELDENGKVANPDTAVILTDNDKVDTPKLKRKKLQYDKDGNIIMEKGWQELQYDKDGNPLLDDKGYPVLLDIREPDYIPGTKEQKYSKNGKYLKPCWKKDTVKHSDVSDIGNIDRIRKTWERLQNEAYEKNNVLDENGKIFSVDLRSYKERNKDLPADQQLIPTRHVGYGMKSESMLIHNEEAKSHNDLVKELRQAAQALKAEQDKLARTEKRLSALHQDNVKFYAVLNPRQAFINSWTSRYNELVAQRNSFEATVLQKLEAGRKVNASNRQRIDRRTKRGNASWNRLNRHSQLMDKMSADIQSVTNYAFDIATLAGKKFDTLSNKEIVAFVRARYGYEVSTIAADVLERNHKDNSNALSGREEKPPYYPKTDTNEIKLQQSVNAITGNPDLASVSDTALSTWDKAQDEAPPKDVMNVLDSYYTAEEFYNAELSGQKWKIVHLDRQYNPDVINRDYNDELKAIAVQEKAEADRRAVEEQERIRKEEADRRAAEEKRKAEEARKEAERLAEEQRRKAEADRRTAELERIRKEEADRRAAASSWSRAEYDRLSAIAKNDIENYRIGAMEAMVEIEYQQQLERNEDYTQEKAIVDKHYNRWKDYEESEQRAKSEYESRNSFFSLHEYTYHIDYDEISRLKQRYENARNELEEKFPTVPPKPDKVAIMREIKRKFGKRQINLLINDTKDLDFEGKEFMLNKIKNSSAKRNEYWKMKPDDPNDPNAGKNNQQTQKKDNTTTIVQPDRKRSKGKGMGM